ncbi:MAG: prepilin-type N-terminal cleavage/methylation domain-containing protein [Luteolibacter sp.]
MKFHTAVRRGFTLVELLVVIAIVITLAAVLGNVGTRMLAGGRTVNCSRNLRQIGMATVMYASDNNMTLPSTSHQRGGRSWTLTLQPYANEKLTSKCAEDANKQRAYTYVINDFLTPHPAGADDNDYSFLSKIARPESTFLFAEAAASHTGDNFHLAPYYGGKIPPTVFEYQVAVGVHGGKANYLFTDGHVETLSWKEIRARLAADGTRFADPSGL